MILDVIITCIVTVLAGLGISGFKELVLMKDLADNGYLFDIKRTKEFIEEVDANRHLDSWKINFIPFFGLAFSLINLTQYFLFRQQSLMALNMSQTLQRMPENLQREYQQNPSLLKAFLINLTNVSNDQYIVIPDKKGNQSSKFRYQINEETNDIEILDVKGPATSLSYPEQKEMIIKAWQELRRQIAYEYETIDGFEEAFKDSKEIVLDDSPLENILAEEAQIASIKLRQIDADNSYFEVSLVDEEGVSLGTFGSPLITDPINFRKQVYGLLEACNITDLLKLGGKANINIPITFKCNSHNHVNEIHNTNNQTFHLTSEGEYLTEETQADNREEFEGSIASIVSENEAFIIRINNPHFTASYNTGNIYYGFGYPRLSETKNPELTKKATRHYQKYLENILKFLGTDDLLKVGGEPIELPKVLIKKDESGNIIALGNQEKDYYLCISHNGYKIEKGKLVINKNKGKKLISEN